MKNINTVELLVPISVGELYDKISILEIKSEKIKDIQKLENITNELVALKSLTAGSDFNTELFLQLKNVNAKLWEIEDEIRILEKEKNFGEKFISLARGVYITNDERSKIKNVINSNFSSYLREEKSYESY